MRKRLIERLTHSKQGSLGYTLTEMLVVIAIIAIACAIAIPSIFYLRDMLRFAQSDAKRHQPEEPEPQEEEQSVENTAYFQLRQRVSELLEGLDDRDAELLKLRFGLEGSLPLSPEETGRKLGMTPEEVIAHETAALTKLRNQ